jgi:pimeloyl-ACP methyl ester carboxylesterase
MDELSKTKLVGLFGATLELKIVERGDGRPFLLLHGGAGPASVEGLADGLSQAASTVVPTHPGFDGEPRPAWFATIEHLVLTYLALLDRLNVRNGVVVGNSLGGWIAAELALRKSPRIAAMVLLNAVGIDTGSPEKSIVDLAILAPADRLALSFHDPKRSAKAPSGAAAANVVVNNQRTLRVYAGEPFMHDPALRPRLAQLSIPTLVLWGESDRIVDTDYGRRYASSIPGSRFGVIPKAAHFPQIERLPEVVGLINDFVAPL